ncbi:MAG: EAL domain-containing protein [Burkholderiaceae bacterium]
MAEQTSRLLPPDLVKALHARHQTTSKSRSALLVVHLNRSDRIQALAQQPNTKLVLIEVIKRVNSMLRPNDRYAIVSPDEIWLLLCDLPSESLAELASRTLRESLMRPITINSEDDSLASVQLRPVIGGGWTPGGFVSDPMSLVNAAAEAAVRARNSDDHILLDKLDSDAAVVHRDTLERELRAALYGNELDVYFQPQIDLTSGSCVAAEALIRWIRPDGKSVNPALIASVCEERGMMAQLTQFVLNSALRHLMFWRGQDIDISVGINLSAVTLADKSFPALVEQSLGTWSIPGEFLTLELTESSIVQHEMSAIEFMKSLKAFGCQLAIDDFGTGYSSFSYLRQFPLDELKIDQSFVRDIANDNGDRQIVSALIDLAHTFEMHALAEGIETPEALAVLEELGCDRGQGYHYERPVPANDFTDWYFAHQASLLAHNE